MFQCIFIWNVICFLLIVLIIYFAFFCFVCSLTYLRESHECHNSEEYSRRFYEVIEDFQPVFHKFFLEMFTSPAEWLSRRTAYTRSCAVNSIVGFVVGLGDR